MSSRLKLPRLYPILDAELLARASIPLAEAALTLYHAGVRWVQYRNKQGSDAEVAESMRVLRVLFPADEAILLVNDRVHLCGETGADGVHIGQGDMPPGEARALLGPERLLGVSTHNVTQLREAASTGAADYLAIGPVFATTSKENPDPVVGLGGVREARALTRLPLVAIGGISAENAHLALGAGADAVAVISALLPQADCDMSQTVRDFLLRLR